MQTENPFEALEADPLVTSADTSAPQPFSGARGAEASPVAGAAAAILDEDAYTLTIEQARELFLRHRRRVPAARTLQERCQEKKITALKMPTSYGQEWLIYEPSLLAYIADLPEITIVEAPRSAAHAEQVAPSSAVTSAEAAPEIAVDASVRDARGAGDNRHPAQNAPAESSARAAEAPATEDADGPIGERRTLAQVLIENAKLYAQLTGKDEVIKTITTGKDETISALKDNIDFIRDELKDRRRFSSDTKQLAERMLQTLEAMATRNSLPEATRHPRRTDTVPFDELRGGNRQHS